MARGKNPNNEQVHEMLRCANDPVYFIKSYIKVIHPVQDVVSLELYDYQVDMINAMHTGKRK